MKNLIFIFIVLLLASCSPRESFKGEAEFLKPFIEDLKNPDNFEAIHNFSELKHKTKGYTISCNGTYCSEYTIVCNGDIVHELDCGLRGQSWVNKIEKEFERCKRSILVSKLNCNQ